MKTELGDDSIESIDFLIYCIQKLKLEDQLYILSKVTNSIHGNLVGVENEAKRLDFIAGISDDSVRIIKKYNLMGNLMELVVQRQQEENLATSGTIHR